MSPGPESRGESVTPKVTEFRYSARHGGWFWEAEVSNPMRPTLPDGRPAVLGSRLTESGYADHHWWAQHCARRGVKRLARRHRKAVRALALSGRPTDVRAQERYVASLQAIGADEAVIETARHGRRADG